MTGEAAVESLSWMIVFFTVTTGAGVVAGVPQIEPQVRIDEAGAVPAACAVPLSTKVELETVAVPWNFAWPTSAPFTTVMPALPLLALLNQNVSFSNVPALPPTTAALLASATLKTNAVPRTVVVARRPLAAPTTSPPPLNAEFCWNRESFTATGAPKA